jgi:GNAT superfamily N-acetyltransferase
MLAKKAVLIAILFNIVANVYSSSDYTIELITGKNLKQFLPFIAEQCITTFKEYPYLYCGDYEEEINFRTPLVELHDSSLAVAYYKGTVIGFLTGYKFTDFGSHFTKSIDLFIESGLKPEEYYYFGEIIIVPEHRGNHLSSKLFSVLESYAQKLGYKATCIVTEEHESHPLKPRNYPAHDSLWNFLGYQKTSFVTNMNWQTYQSDGSVADQMHPLTYWIKFICD